MKRPGNLLNLPAALFRVVIVGVIISGGLLREGRSEQAPSAPAESDAIRLANERLRQMQADRRQRALAEFQAHPDEFPELIRKAILDQRVVIGMTPRQAELAGGPFHYQVIADPKKWPNGTNPMRVLFAQTSHPDDSEIWMAFRNDTQFPEAGMKPFRVYFEKGRVARIEMR